MKTQMSASAIQAALKLIDRDTVAEVLEGTRSKKRTYILCAVAVGVAVALMCYAYFTEPHNAVPLIFYLTFAVPVLAAVISMQAPTMENIKKEWNEYSVAVNWFISEVTPFLSEEAMLSLRDAMTAVNVESQDLTKIFNELNTVAAEKLTQAATDAANTVLKTPHSEPTPDVPALDFMQGDSETQFTV